MKGELSIIPRRSKKRRRRQALTPLATEPLATPRPRIAATGDGSVTIEWDPIENAHHYDAYLTTKEGKARVVSHVTSPFTLTIGDVARVTIGIKAIPADVVFVGPKPLER